MFGFVQKPTCATPANDKERFRLHYCGTCKAIGNDYGQSARMLLNFDAVFLSDLLSSLSNQETKGWEVALHAKNCFHLPKHELPLSLRYAAAANVLLAKLKSEDNIADSKFSIGWRALGVYFSRSFRRSVNTLEQWQVPVSAIIEKANSQVKLENNFTPTDNFQHSLEMAAAPTADMTAQIFSNGARVVGNEAAMQTMAAFGAKFGAFIYSLDAFEDFEKDAQKGNFNPLLSHFQHDDKEARNATLQNHLLTQKDSLLESLNLLPLSLTEQTLYGQRINGAFASRVYGVGKSCCSAQKKTTWKDRYQNALLAAAKYTEPLRVWHKQLAVYSLALAIFAVPRTQDYLEMPGHSNPFSYLAVFTAMLAGMGLLSGKIKKIVKENAPNDGCADCCNSCNGCSDSGNTVGQCCVGCTCATCQCCANDPQGTSQCCGSCCDGMCDDANCCDGCGDGCSKRTWLIVGLILLFVGLSVAAALVLIA